MSPLDLLAEGIDMALNGRRCVIPQIDGPSIPVVEYLGLVRDLTWLGLRSLEDEGVVTIIEHTGDPLDHDEGLTALVLVADRVFPVQITEWAADDPESSGAGSIATIYPNEIEKVRSDLAWPDRTI